MMRFDLESADRKTAYKLLAGLVTPRPIAWVSTVDGEGRPNVAPFSFFNVVGSRPPIVVFAPGDKEPGVPKDTARNVEQTGEFVVNLVDEEAAAAMNLTSAPLDAGVSEFEFAGITPVASERVRPPRIAEAPVSFECRTIEVRKVGDNRLVLGEVLLVWVRDGVLDPERLRVRPEAYRPVGRMHGPGGYTRTRDRFELERPAADAAKKS